MQKITKALDNKGSLMEATPGFEPGDKGFADLCLTTWLCRHMLDKLTNRCVVANDLARSRTQVRSLRLGIHTPCTSPISLRIFNCASSLRITAHYLFDLVVAYVVEILHEAWFTRPGI